MPKLRPTRLLRSFASAPIFYPILSSSPSPSPPVASTSRATSATDHPEPNLSLTQIAAFEELFLQRGPSIIKITQNERIAVCEKVGTTTVAFKKWWTSRRFQDKKQKRHGAEKDAMPTSVVETVASSTPSASKVKQTLSSLPCSASKEDLAELLLLMERTVKAKGEALARPRREAIQVPVEGDEFELLRTYAKEPDERILFLPATSLHIGSWQQTSGLSSTQPELLFYVSPALSSFVLWLPTSLNLCPFLPHNEHYKLSIPFSAITSVKLFRDRSTDEAVLVIIRDSFKQPNVKFFASPTSAPTWHPLTTDFTFGSQAIHCESYSLCLPRGRETFDILHGVFGMFQNGLYRKLLWMGDWPEEWFVDDFAELVEPLQVAWGSGETVAFKYRHPTREDVPALIFRRAFPNRLDLEDAVNGTRHGFEGDEPAEDETEDENGHEGTDLSTPDLSRASSCTAFTSTQAEEGDLPPTPQTSVFFAPLPAPLNDRHHGAHSRSAKQPILCRGSSSNLTPNPFHPYQPSSSEKPVEGATEGAFASCALSTGSLVDGIHFNTPSLQLAREYILSSPNCSSSYTLDGGPELEDPDEFTIYEDPLGLYSSLDEEWEFAASAMSLL